MAIDGINWHCTWGVRKFDEDAVAWLTGRLGRTPLGADFLAAGIDPYEHNVIENNLLVNTGLTRINNLIIGTASTQALTAAATRIGVGDNSAASSAAVTDVALGAASNKYFQTLDSTPTVSTGQVTYVATFTSANGNFLWSEFCVDVNTAVGSASSGTTANTLINRKTGIAQGTKSAGQSWTASATITLS